MWKNLSFKKNLLGFRFYSFFGFRVRNGTSDAFYINFSKKTPTVVMGRCRYLKSVSVFRYFFGIATRPGPTYHIQKSGHGLTWPNGRDLVHFTCTF